MSIWVRQMLISEFMVQPPDADGRARSQPVDKAVLSLAGLG
ncbi:MAG TPA: hypothetical protein VGU71_21565 [Candidatus Dormibacteraeota bacterium]|nr:hypothetical protein [Candidatus Dormibacteraeota bacterium]